jgi:hypothetical protein
MQTVFTDDGSKNANASEVVDVEDPADAADDGDDEGGGGGATSNDDNDNPRNSNTTKWRLISFAALLIATAFIVVAISLGVTLGGGGTRIESMVLANPASTNKNKSHAPSKSLARGEGLFIIHDFSHALCFSLFYFFPCVVSL